MKYRYILLLILSLSFSGEVLAQYAKSEKIRPQWLHKLPKPSNTTFVYETDYATGKSLDDARTKSLNGLIAASGFESGVVVLSDYKSQTVDSKVYSNGKLSDYQIDAFETNSHVKGNEVQLHVKSVAEYWTRDINGTVNLTTLYAKSLNGTPIFDDVELTTSYVSDPATWGLALIPGAAQFHKGSYLKGGLLLGGTVALVGGIIFTENQRADYVSKIAKTHDADIKRAYATRRDHFATGRNMCIGAAAALYVYNLIDAIVAPGARRVVVKQRPNGNTYAVLPAISADGNPMMMVSITF